jgi:uncharacterized protein (TIGR03437 family)
LQFTPQSASGFEATAQYAGSDALWPAQASAPLDTNPRILSSGIVNGADFEAEPLSAGAWFTIFGNNLGGAAEAASVSTTLLGGATVSVCGLPAFINYNSGLLVTNGTAGWLLDALMPDEVAGKTSCPVVVTVNGQAAPTVTVSIASGIMELFAFSSSAGMLPIVTHSDYSLVGPVSAGLIPGKPGETLIAWGTGDCAVPTVTVGSASAAVIFSGRAGPGVCQINFSVPGGLTGANPLQISTSTSSYTLWVTP